MVLNAHEGNVSANRVKVEESPSNPLLFSAAPTAGRSPERDAVGDEAGAVGVLSTLDTRTTLPQHDLVPDYDVGVPKRISHLQFGLISAADIQRLAEFEIDTSKLYTTTVSSITQQQQRGPAPGGCLDARLGVSDKQGTCATCHLKLTDCAGHFGYIKLALPVFHIGYLRHVLHILQCICKTCSSVLLSEADRQAYLGKMRHPQTDVLAKTTLLRKLVERCKKVHKCPHCQAWNGVVKKVASGGASAMGGSSVGPAIRIVHDRYKGKQAEEELDELEEALNMAVQANPAVAAALRRHQQPPQEDLLPTTVQELLTHISDADCEILFLDPLLGRPEHLLLQNLLVPPVPIRPSVAMDVGGGSNEDDLTVKLQEIIDLNQALQGSLTKGAATRHVLEQWDLLQTQIAQYMNGEMPGIQRPMGAGGSKGVIRGLCQRLKGKQGRFRGNLSGKRVDFSARTVISPDPNLAVDQVGVPMQVVRTMTYPERVTRCNIERLQQLVLNGPNKFPGANFVRLRDGSFTKSLAFGDRKVASRTLKLGDTVERHMQDGDVVLFNRQPSLHKVSIMAHRVKVMAGKTFRFNTCVCAPYNADFDGDEMNMHLPQTEEARAEASLLMGVTTNLTTPRNGEPLVAASQDFLSAAYLLTQRDQFFSREVFCQMVGFYSVAEEDVVLPSPAIVKPVELWTGKQVFSVMLCPNRANTTPLSLEAREKSYTAGHHFCPNDGWVAFCKGHLISGNVAKKTLGDGSKVGLLYVLLRDFGAEHAATVMNRWARFCSRYMGSHRGLSIGISDVTPSDRLLGIKHDILSEGYKKAEGNIVLFEEGRLELRPGCDMLQSLEEILNGILGRLREAAGQEAMKALEWSNSPRIMADSGAKGSPLNISQMISCVGQQAVGGVRIQNGFTNRTLPHFEYHSLTPEAKGFVANSFYTGLSPTEFFFHAMGGREGLVDTAVKTAETGYMARRLMKALEDLSLQYDGSVRNSENTVVQLVYGDDGLDPDKMEENGRPFNLERLYLRAIHQVPSVDEESFSREALLSELDRRLAAPVFQGVLPAGSILLDDIRSFFMGLAEAHREAVGQAGTITPFGFREWSAHRITPSQLDLMLDLALQKYIKAMVQPGEAVGAIGAQSISEPGTQMTLKTFHFSGISSMNVTLGVPRLKEIINAAKVISTPIITARLVHDRNKIAARMVKAMIEKTMLGEISREIKEHYGQDACYIGITLDLEAIAQLRLNIDAHVVRSAILHGTRGITRPAVLRALKPQDVLIKKGSLSKVRVYAPELKSANQSLTSRYFAMQMLKAALPDVVVQGIPSISRAVINEIEKTGTPSYNLLMEGYGFKDVVGCPGVDGLHTTTNHVLEVESVLGVEAARCQIAAEIENIMSAYGIGIDHRHLLLLADIMTFKGEVLGITRFGVARMRESVLMLASFEKTTDHLFDAAVHGRNDAIVGVSECIIMGMEVPVGTGLPSLFWKTM